MGTRFLAAAALDGEYKIAQYGQFDGYPEGAGVNILSFLQDIIETNRVEEFKNKLKTCVLSNRLTISESFYNSAPQFNIGLGEGIFDFILSGNGDLILENNIRFASNSLHCEWGYVIDFDRERLECYKGFNKTPLSEDDRFSIFELFAKNNNSEGYHPIKKIYEISFKDIRFIKKARYFMY